MSTDITASGPGRTRTGPRPPEPAQRTAARVAGFLYIVQMATGVFGFYAHGRLIARGDPVQTAQNIAASERLFRFGTASNLVTSAVVVVLLWALYVALSPVDRNLALLAAFLRLAENSIAAATVFTDFLVLRLLGDASYSRAFGASQSAALARLLVGGQAEGLRIAFLFLGLGTAVFGHLWWRSRYISRWLAGLGIFGGCCCRASRWPTWCSQFWRAP